MTYYNIPVSMRFSHIRQGNKDLGPHAWLTISSDTATYDLDPSIYKRFVPLVERDPDLEITTLKEEYIVKKRIILKK